MTRASRSTGAVTELDAVWEFGAENGRAKPADAARVVVFPLSSCHCWRYLPMRDRLVPKLVNERLLDRLRRQNESIEIRLSHTADDGVYREGKGQPGFDEAVDATSLMRIEVWSGTSAGGFGRQFVPPPCYVVPVIDAPT